MRWLSASQTLVLVSLLSHVCTCLSIHYQPALKLLQHLVVGYAEYMISSDFEAMVARIAGHPGTILSQVESKAFEEWAPGFYERLRSHMKRASDSIGLGASTLLACHQSIWISSGSHSAMSGLAIDASIWAIRLSCLSCLQMCMWSVRGTSIRRLVRQAAMDGAS